jgi:hypothetical protein
MKYINEIYGLNIMYFIALCEKHAIRTHNLGHTSNINETRLAHDELHVGCDTIVSKIAIFQGEKYNTRNKLWCQIFAMTIVFAPRGVPDESTQI